MFERFVTGTSAGLMALARTTNLVDSQKPFFCLSCSFWNLVTKFRRHSSLSPTTEPQSLFHERPLGFVFDLDGVLFRGPEPLPQAFYALSKLYFPCRKRPRFPLAFLTNGGGMTEGKRAEKLSDLLGYQITADQVVMAHTPMMSLVQAYRTAAVVVCGKGTPLEVAASYGFENAASTEELAELHPSAVPLCFSLGFQAPPLTASCPRRTPASPFVGRAGRGGSGGGRLRSSGFATADDPVRAVLVMTDPTDWGRDVQLIADLVASGGVIEGRPPVPSGPVKVFFGHSDLLWAAEFPRPRFGLGAFALALEVLYERATGEPLPSEYFGKPRLPAFREAERSLLGQARRMAAGSGGPAPALEAIYMFGDNPPVDIRGAKAAAAEGLPWRSVLVRTGVFQEGANSDTDPADIVASDVSEAVSMALKRSCVL
uniref:Had hydrolase n=1 Tax=Tetraselmis sp. GSL018 TaxID=582737 RepID=A0A061RP60_9CHLO